MKDFFANSTKCLLIHPQFSPYSSLNYDDVCKIVGAKYPVPPLGLLTVAALLPQDWNFKLIDINVEPLLDSHLEWADIICTGGMLSQQRGILSIIDKAHHHGKKVVIGGPEPTCQPQLYQKADYLVLDEGENSIPLFLKALQNGEEHGEYRSLKLADMTEAVVPRFDLIKLDDYLMMAIQFSRGCPYNCEFCNVIELFGRESRTKSPKHILKELETLYDLGYRGHIFFVDDNFLSHGIRVEKLLLVMSEWSKEKKYPFFFAAEASINLANKDRFLELMRDIDFRYISIGIETPDDKVLKMAQKQQNVNKPIVEIMKKIYSYGILVDSCLIIGFDHETDMTADLIIKCIQDSGIPMAMVGTLFALPNTQLAQRLQKEGRLFKPDTTIGDSQTEIDQMSSGLNFETSRPRKEILNDYIKILDALYSPVNYFQRLTLVGLLLKRQIKHRPTFRAALKRAPVFFKICRHLGFQKKTGFLFWKTFVIILITNPKALEAVLSLSAMYIHFSRHSQFIINLTRNKMNALDCDTS